MAAGYPIPRRLSRRARFVLGGEADDVGDPPELGAADAGQFLDGLDPFFGDEPVPCLNVDSEQVGRLPAGKRFHNGKYYPTGTPDASKSFRSCPFGLAVDKAFRYGWCMSMTEVPRWTLPERLAKAREHAHLDRDQMARLLGVTERTIRNWENGRIIPKRKDILAYSAATHVPLVWLTGEWTPSGPSGQPPGNMFDTATYTTGLKDAA